MGQMTFYEHMQYGVENFDTFKIVCSHVKKNLEIKEKWGCKGITEVSTLGVLGEHMFEYSPYEEAQNIL